MINKIDFSFDCPIDSLLITFDYAVSVYYNDMQRYICMDTLAIHVDDYMIISVEKYDSTFAYYKRPNRISLYELLCDYIENYFILSDNSDSNYNNLIGYKKLNNLLLAMPEIKLELINRM